MMGQPRAGPYGAKQIGWCRGRLGKGKRRTPTDTYSLQFSFENDAVTGVEELIGDVFVVLIRLRRGRLRTLITSLIRSLGRCRATRTGSLR